MATNPPKGAGGAYSLPVGGGGLLLLANASEPREEG
jgi:hypothetical protein